GAAVIDGESVGHRGRERDAVAVGVDLLVDDRIGVDDGATDGVGLDVGVADDGPGGDGVVGGHLDPVAPGPTLLDGDDELLVGPDLFDALGPVHVVGAVFLLEGTVAEPVAVDQPGAGRHADDGVLLRRRDQHRVEGGEVAEQVFRYRAALHGRGSVLRRPHVRLRGY